MGSLFAGLASLAGGLGSDIFNVFSAKNYRNWMQHMSNTAIQRRQSDLKKAGINPILAAGVGGSASQPSAAAPTVNSPVPSAFSSASAKANINNMKMQNKNLLAQNKLIVAQARQANSAAALSLAHARATTASMPSSYAKGAKGHADTVYYTNDFTRGAYYFHKFLSHIF